VAHDIFVSYASKDKPTADAIVAALEAAAKVMIVVLSMAANASRQVVREVERAVNKGLVIVPISR
jgi:hypothetical protein